MNIKITGGRCEGKIKSIPSKSYAHRIAICNFLSGNKIDGGCFGYSSEDIKATVRCLNSLLEGENVLDCGESGSTLRFILPLVAARGGQYRLVGHGKLMERPNDELFRVLEDNGVNVKMQDGIIVDGKLRAGNFKIRGDISSQYISGLLLCLPTLSGDSFIELTTPLLSKPYVEITLEVLSGYGIEIKRLDNGYFVKGGQQYNGNLMAEGDWSNAAFFLVLGAISGNITLSGLNLSSAQGDRVIMQVLKDAGAKIEVDGDDVKVSKNKLLPFNFNAEDYPDLVPIVAVLASQSNGVSVIENVERLKIKESDRINSTLAMLNVFGIKAEYKGSNIYVYGGTAKGGTAHSFNDHRIAMASAVLATATNGESLITNANAVNKSYPEFFDDLKSVGGVVEYV